MPMNRRILILTVLMLAVSFAALAAEPPQSERPKTVTLKVMTYNLHHCEGEDGVYDVARIAAFIKELGADIVLCQEVDKGFSDRSRNEDQPEMLASALGFQSFYGPNIEDTYGNLILSRYPIERAGNLPLPNPEDREPRGVIVAYVNVNGLILSVLDTHLCAFSAANRKAQIAFLQEFLTKSPYPLLFGADFNTRPSAQLKPLLDDGAVTATRDAILSLGEGIDDILVSKDLAGSVKRGEVVEKPYSDHPAYWIEITVDTPGTAGE